jgi:hypothetical protein
MIGACNRAWFCHYVALALSSALSCELALSWTVSYAPIWIFLIGKLPPLGAAKCVLLKYQIAISFPKRPLRPIRF